jgi:hypothetical protein
MTKASFDLSSSGQRKALIVERKLVRNRGHHHTQIASIEELLPGYEIMLLTGSGYDGFLSYPAWSVTANVSRDGRLARRNAYGPLFRRLANSFARGLFGRNPRYSNFGTEMFEAISASGLKDTDLIIIPSATLDDLSAVAEAYGRLDPSHLPQCFIRFLDPCLGEPSARLREAQMAALLRKLPQEIRLFCETEEMADHMSRRFHHPFAGGFYLPCTLDPRKEWERPKKNFGDPFRVGVFGIPRKEKGALRIAPIMDAIGKARRGSEVEFIIQGHESDFQPDGFYAKVATTSSHVGVRRLIGALDPDEFQKNFLLNDVILLPYDVSVYGLQGSGLVQDAVAANIPITYSHGMSMQRFLNCGNAVAATSDDEFAEAILDLSSNCQNFWAGCRAANSIFQEILHGHPIKQL